LGIMASDKNVRAAVISQTPFLMLFPDTIATKCIRSITAKLIDTAGQTTDIPLELFWDKCLSFLEKHHAVKKEPAPSKKDELEKFESEKVDQDKIKKDPDPVVTQALSQIESKLSMLMKEVGEIKTFLKIREKPPEIKQEIIPDPGKIALDFEDWLKKNNRSI